MSTFFIADPHLGHENIIKFENRPFKSVDEMDDELIQRWNKKVGKNDLVYVIGDFIWDNRINDPVSIIKSLHGQIILIRGNHDRFANKPEVKAALKGILDYADIPVTLANGTQKRCILSHYFIPLYNGYRYGAIHLHGHSHNTEESDEERCIIAELQAKGYPIKVYNLGCVYWNFEPVTLDEILKRQNELG